MGFLFTFLYVTISYLTPPVLFGPLAEFHVEILVALMAILFSMPSLTASKVWRTPQSVAMAGMACAIFLSIVVSGWFGGAVSAFYGFMQPLFTFYLLAVNCKTRRHFQWITLGLLVASTYFMVQGYHDLRNNVIPSDYLYGDDTLRRLRGLGTVNDPNDFAQVMVSLIPCVFLWRKKSGLINIVGLGVPIAILLTGMFLTHSRGSILALLAVVIVSVRRKIGTVPALIIAGALFSASFAVNWSGGRDISMEGGSDRLDLWSEGLELIRSHPLFGIGLNAFADFTGHTAHNSVVVCAAETGIVGLYFWVLFVSSTLRLGILLGLKDPVDQASAEEQVEENGIAAGNGWFPPLALEKSALAEPSWAGHGPLGNAALRKNEATASLPPAWPSNFEAEQSEDDDTRPSVEDVSEMTRLFFFALTGMLVAGWFLSRAFSQWLFLYCGMMYAASQMKTRDREVVLPDGRAFLFKLSAVVTVALLVGVYLMLRLRLVGDS